MKYTKTVLISLSVTLAVLFSGTSQAGGRLALSQTYRGSGDVDSMSIYGCDSNLSSMNMCIGMVYEERLLSAYDPYNFFLALDMGLGRNPQFYGSVGFDPSIAISQMIGSIFPFIPTADGYDVRYEIGVRAKFSNMGGGLSMVRVTPSTAAGSIYDSYQATFYLYF